MSAFTSGGSLGAALILAALTNVARGQAASSTDAIEREGLHFQIAFGWGGGPTSNGVLHDMELGGTLSNGWTLAYQHVFIWSDGIAKPAGGSDLWGGHHVLLEVPVHERIVCAMSLGVGENVDMESGFDARFGVGTTVGVEVDFPIWPTSGITLSATALQAITVDVGFQIGAGVTAGYTWF